MSQDAPTDGAPKVDPPDERTMPVGRRFEKGNTFGKGNPLAKRQAEYRRAFQEAITDDDMRGIARAAIDAACEGDVAAMRFVAEYTLGKPVAAEADEGDADTLPKGRLEIRFIPAPATPHA